jgi:hypothetical protein
MESRLQSITKPTGAMGVGPRLSITVGSKAQRGGEDPVRIIGKEPLK